MSTRRTAVIVFFLVFQSAIYNPQSAMAEGVAWRTDYAKARKEAADTGRPLVIDLTTDDCYWCKQLDARTFTDAAVVGLLNGRCVPLKVDAGKDPFLAQALRVQSYPTLVFAAPEGKVLGYQEGFLEGPALKAHLEKVLAAVSAPEWMARDVEEAGRALAKADYAKAIPLLQGVLEDGKDRPVQAKARKLLGELEGQAGERLAKARQLAATGKEDEASAAVQDLAEVYPGTPAARDGKQFLLTLARKDGGKEERARQAKELLRQAKDDYRAQLFLCCLDRCEALAAKFADLPEGAEGARLAAEVKANPDWAKAAADQLGERLCVLYLALAESALKKGQPQQAVFYLERVVKAFPNTRHAEAAQVRLTRLRGAPDKGKD